MCLGSDSPPPPPPAPPPAPLTVPVPPPVMVTPSDQLRRATADEEPVTPTIGGTTPVGANPTTAVKKNAQTSGSTVASRKNPLRIELGGVARGTGGSSSGLNIPV